MTSINAKTDKTNEACETMNILLSIHHGLDHSAGAPGVTVKLADALSGRGHAVRVISFDDLKRLPGKLRGVVFPWMVFAHVLKHPEYDVLDLSSGDGWVVNVARRVFGWRSKMLTATRSHGLEQLAHEMLLQGCRDGIFTKSWKYPLYNGSYRLWECRKSFQMADLLLLLNETERQYASKRFGVDAQKIATVGNGIDECFAGVARRLIANDEEALPDLPVNVAFAGRATFWKGFPFLVEAMTAVLARYPQMKLGLFGTGGTEQSVLAEFPESLRAQVVVMPRYENHALPELLADYQIFAFPSLGEPFGIAPLEAMACGLVPIVAEAPGPGEYIRNGKNGVVVPPRDSAALARAIVEMVEDRERRLELRRAALRSALWYSWGDLAARLELVYCQHRQKSHSFEAI
ncbi:glycosyltransferase family 4 protein [Paraburkholderia sp. J67]|uniref:glycosyltransferase family 4 protein n=1 Tax=Paraburkholderia sp. J67 TaxID=2805435 RepID=UPI002ABDDA74|nr:glycosyltransferase family 4 protein [Paraburkholderia sp. J67]